MLIRYSVENFMCFKGREEFSMLTGLGRLHPNHKVSAKNKKDISVLKAGLIYGANASGKSALIKSMDWARNFIISGSKPDSSISSPKFKLDKKSLKSPSRFEFEIKYKDKNYAYGFIINESEVVEEWLFLLYKNSEKKIFERSNTLSFYLDDNLYQGKSEEAFLSFLLDTTRENQLFLTHFNDKKIIDRFAGNNLFMDVLNWFKQSLTIIFPNSKVHGIEFEIEENNDLKQSFKYYLKKLGTGIDGIELNPVNIEDIADIPKDILNETVQQIKKDSKVILSNAENNSTYALVKKSDSAVKIFKLVTCHKNNSSNKIYFDINEESDGSQRLIELIPALIDMSKSEKVFVIDELDRSLHATLSKTIFQLFFEKTQNIKSQLIVTTHETSLLDLKLLRKDEIWFVEKNSEGESQLFSLEEFNLRFDKEIRKDYLLGRFGAVPAIDVFNEINTLN